MPPLCSCPRIGTIPAGAEGPTPGAGLQDLPGVPLILRAMLNASFPERGAYLMPILPASRPRLYQ